MSHTPGPGAWMFYVNADEDRYEVVVGERAVVLFNAHRQNADLLAAFSRYGDHDRACDARENALYACTCGFVETVERVTAIAWLVESLGYAGQELTKAKQDVRRIETAYETLSDKDKATLDRAREEA